MGSTEDSGNWVLDYDSLIKELGVPGGELPSLEAPGALWSSHNFPNTTASLSGEFGESFGYVDTLKENGSKKRVRSESCNASHSKACREKMRRERMNDRFTELSTLLDPGRPPKVDKSAILVDAARMVSQLRDEAQKLKESNKTLQQKIIDLKGEKNELRDEKQRLKTEKDNLELQIKVLSTPPSFLAPPPAIMAPFSAPPRGQVIGSKLVPFIGYPGASMWQFMPPAAVDTSQDHVLRPPVA